MTFRPPPPVFVGGSQPYAPGNLNPTVKDGPWVAPPPPPPPTAPVLISQFDATHAGVVPAPPDPTLYLRGDGWRPLPDPPAPPEPPEPEPPAPPRLFFFHEYPPQGTPNGVGYSDMRGRIRQSRIIADRANTKIIIIDGQSEHATANGTFSYAPVSPHVHNLDLYTGDIFLGADPVPGASYAAGTFSSMTNRIGDRIISNVKAAHVLLANIAMGGTPWAMYDPAASGSLFTRFQAIYWRLEELGLIPDDVVVGRGTTDGGLGTSTNSARDSAVAWIDGVRGLGYSGRIWLNKFTLQGAGGASTAVRAGIDAAVAARSNVYTGYDGDTHLTIAGGHRLADGVHLSDLGLTTGGYGIADMLYPP